MLIKKYPLFSFVSMLVIGILLGPLFYVYAEFYSGHSLTNFPIYDIRTDGGRIPSRKTNFLLDLDPSMNPIRLVIHQKSTPISPIHPFIPTYFIGVSLTTKDEQNSWKWSDGLNISIPQQNKKLRRSEMSSALGGLSEVNVEHYGKHKLNILPPKENFSNLMLKLTLEVRTNVISAPFYITIPGTIIMILGLLGLIGLAQEKKRAKAKEIQKTKTE